MISQVMTWYGEYLKTKSCLGQVESKEIFTYLETSSNCFCLLVVFFK